MKTPPPILLIPTFSNFVQTPSPPRFQPPTPCTFCCHFSLTEGWLRHIWCVILLSDIMGQHMSRLSTLVPEGLCSVFYATSTKFTEVWHIMGFFASTLIWYYTDTKDTQPTQGPVDWHTHINTRTPKTHKNNTGKG